MDQKPPELPNIVQYAEIVKPNEDPLLSDLHAIDLTILKQQRDLIHEKPNLPYTFEPFTSYSHYGKPEDFSKGKELIAEGKVGCLLLAGGQGSRLGYNGPKGCYPISVVKNRSLFQICAEKVVAASKQAGRPLMLAIMTSNQNDQEIRNFFNENKNFGLSKDQISFFSQSDLPLLTEEGNLFLETPTQIAKGPDGNGRCLEHLVKSGIWAKWHQAGIKFVNLILIDNSLADPFDAELFGMMDRKGVDIGIKCTEKKYPEEKVGMLVKVGNNCQVIEYSEMPEETKKEVDNSGHLAYCCANISLFGFTMDFVKAIGDSKEPMPLHKAWKAVPYMDDNGVTQHPDKPNAWKFEAFIFDVMSRTTKVEALLYPREITFAPLKNAKGNDSPESVRAALQTYDALVLKNITGVESPTFSFELSSDFYYPTPALLKSWKGRVLDKEGYVEAN